MKKFLTVMFIAVFACFAWANLSFAAAAASKALSISAVVPAVAPEMDIVILKITDGDPDQNPWTNSTDVTSTMNLGFGTLIHTYTDGTGATKEAGVWYSPNLYCVVVYAQGYSKKYEIRSSCAGVGTIPNTYNYFGVMGVYAAADKWSAGDLSGQGAMPAGAIVNGGLTTPINAIGTTFKSIYQSEVAPSTARILQAYYSVPTKKADGSVPYTGWTGIPLTQTAGTFTGNVTLSIVAI